MTKLVKDLASELREVFGTSFGKAPAPQKSLSEAVEQAITERRDGTKKAPQRNPFGKERMQAGKTFAAKQDKNIKKNLDDFHKYANAEGEKSSKRPKPDKLQGRDKTPWKHTGSSVAGKGRHNPFKRAANLGKGPGTPPGRTGPGPRHHDQAKCWHCQCGNIYTKGCQCVGTGATKDCPKGHIKHVQVKHDYRKAYNKMYHKWRGQERASGDGVTKRLASRGRS